jgi:hypothetical protein
MVVTVGSISQDLTEVVDANVLPKRHLSGTVDPVSICATSAQSSEI